MNWKSIGRISFLLVAMCCSLLSYADTVWIDVRTAVEHKIDNIEGDIRIPHRKIVQEVHKIFSDKDTEISLYCRSGVRAGKAMSALKEAGYTNVLNMGGIDDARKERDLRE
jgi:phage shock protein E